MDLHPYNCIQRWFSGLQGRFLFLARILKIHRASTEWTDWALSVDLRIPYVYNARRGSNDVPYPHMGKDHDLVVRQSHFGMTIT